MNVKINVKSLIAIIGITVLLISTLIFADDDKVTITGSTTVLPIAQRAAEEFMNTNDEADISVRGGGSGVGISALISGRADIADASRSIKDKELKLAREKGINPKEHIVARDGMAVVVHSDNEIDNIDIETLKKIYTGEISNWKDLGGPSKQIVVISRDYSSGTFEVFKELVLLGDKVMDGAVMLASNKAVKTTIAQTPGAIGYIGLGYLADDVKALKVNGVEPTLETVREGTYELARPLFMYTNGEPTGMTKQFIDFVFSAEGQEIAKNVGYVPVK